MKRTRAVLPLLILAAAVAAPLRAAPVTLKTTEFGHGPTIVFVHGLGGARTAWLPTARKLLGTHHVVMLDLPGHGDSPLPDPFSLGAAAEAVAQVLAAQKPESTIVVGQGAGGLVALMAASTHPERLSGLVLVDVSLRPENPVPDQMQKYFLQMLDEHYDDMLKTLYVRMGRDSAQGIALHAQAVRTPPATIKAYLREMLNADGNKALKGLRTPLLFVGTEKRWPADKDWAAVGKQSGFEDPAPVAARRIGGCGPLVASEQPDSLAAVLTGFERTAVAKK
jgi:pimeloyl-ACP methyl ester carboxylesterase